MNFLLLLLSTCLVTCVVAGSAQYYLLEDAELHFEDFIRKFDKQYADNDEKATRYEIFKANFENINRFNNESSHAVFGITKFSDLTPSEFIQRHTGHLSNLKDYVACDNVVHDGDIPDAGAPESLDWRSSNIVTPVKNQGQCGSCYAFSTIGQIESQYAIKYGQIVDLSEQQIVDCDKLAQGCGGGYMSSTMRELIRFGGAMSETDYPYTQQSSTCMFDANKAVVKLSSCYSYDLQSQEKVKQLLYKNGPVAIVIAAEALQTYHSGIVYDTSCTGPLNHAVLLVGYGTDESGTPYWIVKNSWGSDFGEDGFFRLQRSDDPTGACGILNNMMATGVVQ